MKDARSWHPMQELDRLRQEMNRLFDWSPAWSRGMVSTWQPSWISTRPTPKW